jgi:hypothetical protein
MPIGGPKAHVTLSMTVPFFHQSARLESVVLAPLSFGVRPATAGCRFCTTSLLAG